MILMTSKFGEIEIADDRIIYFSEGIPGFEYLKHFCVLVLEQTAPFYWLQSVEEDVSFPVISPFDLDEKYSPFIEDAVFKELNVEKDEDVLVVNIAVIPSDASKMTVNMAAPIIINVATNLGKQVIVEGSTYLIRQPVFDIIRKMIKERK